MSVVEIECDWTVEEFRSSERVAMRNDTDMSSICFKTFGS